MTLGNQTPTPTPTPKPGTDDLPEDQDTSSGAPTAEDKAEAMEEVQKEGAEQREEGGYQ